MYGLLQLVEGDILVGIPFSTGIFVNFSNIFLILV